MEKNEPKVAEIYLNSDLVNMLHRVTKGIYGDESGPVKLSYESYSIGSVLKATFEIRHKDYDGDFTVTLMDQDDW